MAAGLKHFLFPELISNTMLKLKCEIHVSRSKGMVIEFPKFESTRSILFRSSCMSKISYSQFRRPL